MSSKRCPSCARLYATSERFCSHDGDALEVFQPVDPLLGKDLLGRYKVLDVLGRGGMGIVYLAQQAGIGRTVACKVLAAERTADPSSRARFEREARLIAEMRSPHTVALVDFGAMDDGRLVLVMEHVEGETLRVVLEREGPLEVERAARIVDQVARSLLEAHTRGVVHRDIKPSNILSAPTADYPELVKVVDFGIAALIDQGDDPRLTLTEEAPGTPTYMAPECVAGESPDARADVYSLGVLLFEMVAGRPPFVRSRSADVMAAQLEEKAPLLSDCAPGPVSDEVVGLVARCLAKQRALRPRDAGGFRDALAEAMGWNTEAAPRGGRASDNTLPRAKRRVEPVAVETEPQTRRPVWPIAVGGLAAVGLAAWLVVASASGSGPATQTPAARAAPVATQTLPDSQAKPGPQPIRADVPVAASDAAPEMVSSSATEDSSVGPDAVVSTSLDTGAPETTAAETSSETVGRPIRKRKRPTTTKRQAAKPEPAATPDKPKSARPLDRWLAP